MALGDGGFRIRAATLLRPSLRAANNEEDPNPEKYSILLSPTAEPLLNEKLLLDEHASGDNSLSPSPAGKTRLLDPTIAHDIDANRLVRTIPSQCFLFSQFINPCSIIWPCRHQDSRPLLTFIPLSLGSLIG